MTVSISPVFNYPQFFGLDGSPLAGGMIYTYQAGSDSVQQATYTGIDGLTANLNPVILDSSGRPNTSFWLTNGQLYNIVITDSDGSVLAHYDNVSGVVIPTGGSGGGGSTGIWILETDAISYVSSNQFIIANNHTTDFAVGNRVKATVSAGTVYGTVTASSYASPNTQVTLLMDSTNLDSGLSAIYWSQLIANGRTVDSGGVSFSGTGYGGVIGPLPYSSPNTIGGQITAGIAALATTNTRIDGTYNVWPTSGTGANTPYTITTTPTIASYSVGQIFVVAFASASVGSPTLNVNGLGALPLKMYSYTGALVDAVIPATNISQVAYDGTNWIYLDQIPATPPAAQPHGQSVFSAGGTFTTPANVYSIKVTVVSGGGGGSGGFTTGGDSGEPFPGQVGGSGGTSIAILSTTPGTSYGVTIGLGGAGGGYYSNGSNGGYSTFGASLVQATPGLGGTTTTPGANGYPNIGDYGFYGSTFAIGSTSKGNGGSAGASGGGTGGTGGNGMIVVEW